MAGVILLSLWLRDDFIEKASAEEPNGLTLCTAPFCGPGQVLRLHDMPASSIALSWKYPFPRLFQCPSTEKDASQVGNECQQSILRPAGSPLEIFSWSWIIYSAFDVWLRKPRGAGAALTFEILIGTIISFIPESITYYNYTMYMCSVCVYMWWYVYILINMHVHASQWLLYTIACKIYMIHRSANPYRLQFSNCLFPALLRWYMRSTGNLQHWLLLLVMGR